MGFLSSIFGSTEPHGEDGKSVVVNGKVVGLGDAFRNWTPFRRFTVVTVSGNRYEVDYPDALAVREGLAIFVGPGRVPVFFDNEGVSEGIGDLAGPRSAIKRGTAGPANRVG
jgi:hypothetical protein